VAPVKVNHSTCLVLLVVLLSAACADESATPIRTSTCELRDRGAAFDHKLVEVRGTISTDLMHFWLIESAGCSNKMIQMHFAENAVNDPCGESAFAKTVECPIDAQSWRVEATFIGEFHAAENELSISEMKDILRTRNPPWKPGAT
jgi:hypothetical protein